jgi:hypothetical protein
MLLLDQNFKFFPIVPVVGCNSIILCTGIQIKLLYSPKLSSHSTCIFHKGMNLQENKVYHSKESKIMV